MSFTRRHLSPKARLFLAIGNICLFTSVMMTILGKDFGHHHALLYDGLRGLLLGLAISFNFGAFRFAGRCPEKQV
jgi:flagellar biosynthesis protein FliR